MVSPFHSVGFNENVVNRIGTSNPFEMIRLTGNGIPSLKTASSGFAWIVTGITCSSAHAIVERRTVMNISNCLMSFVPTGEPTDLNCLFTFYDLA